MSESLGVGLASETETKGTTDAWAVETAIDAAHRDEAVVEPAEVPVVIPHARVPVGVWEDVIRLIDGEEFWISEEEFVLAALREKIEREIAVAIRRTAESYGVLGSRVKVDTGEVP